MATSVEIDFDKWDEQEPAKRKEYLTTILKDVKEPARSKFIDEYNKRGATVHSLIHDPTLKKASSGSKLV